jgi:hypothetical protein
VRIWILEARIHSSTGIEKNSEVVTAEEDVFKKL